MPMAMSRMVKVRHGGKSAPLPLFPQHQTLRAKLLAQVRDTVTVHARKRTAARGGQEESPKIPGFHHFT
jgi:hypothetical protein